MTRFNRETLLLLTALAFMLPLTPTGLYPSTTPNAGWLIQPVFAYSTGMSASQVLGQSPPSFTTRTAATTENGVYNPIGLGFDSHSNLWVADYANNRVLEFICTATSSCGNGNNAALVLGYADFTSHTPATTQNGMSWPFDLGFDSHGNLWVADLANSRVLEFTCTATSTCANGNGAALELGQGSGLFTTNAPALTQNGMNGPTGLEFDSHGNLWVTDYNNNRVLGFWVNELSADSSTKTLDGSGGGSFASSLTGVTVTISASTGGASVFIVPQQLSSQSSGVGTLSLSNGKFFDVAISGVTGGTAQVCVTDGSADSKTILQYWSGSAWVTASGITVSGTTVCGNIPVSALQGTNIAAGDPVSTTTTATTTAPPIPEYPLGLPLLAIFMIIAYGLIKRRTGTLRNI